MSVKEYGILVKTNNEVSIVELTMPLHVSLGGYVDGYIEHVNPKGLKSPHCMIVDEEGLCKKKPLNMFGTIVCANAFPIVGDVVFCKDGYRGEDADIIGYSKEEADEIFEIIKNEIDYLFA